MGIGGDEVVGEGAPIEGGMTEGRAGEGEVGGTKKAHIDQTGEGGMIAQVIWRLVRQRFLGRQAGTGAARKGGGVLDSEARMRPGGRTGGGRGQVHDMR